MNIRVGAGAATPVPLPTQIWPRQNDAAPASHKEFNYAIF
jgi:hypothetical protein